MISPIKIPEPKNIKTAMKLSLAENTIVSFDTKKSNEDIRVIIASADPENLFAFTKRDRESISVEICPKKLHDEIFG